MITVKDLSVSYGAVRALSDVTFEAPTGEITAVLGANGAGKTTLLRTISGLVTPKSGTVQFGDHCSLGSRRRTSRDSASLTFPRVGASSKSSPLKRTCASARCSRKVDIAKRPRRPVRRFPILGERRKKLCGDALGR